MKNITGKHAMAMKVVILVSAATFFCIGAQAQDTCLTLAVVINNAMESSIHLNFLFKLFFTALGMSPVIGLLNFASSKAKCLEN